MGRHLMNYRASVIGGSLEIQRAASGGTRVTCIFPVQPPSAESIKEASLRRLRTTE